MNFSSLREKIKAEGAKLKQMRFGDALGYIVTYYGVAIFIIAVVLIFVISITSDVRKNIARVPIVTVGVMQDYEVVAEGAAEAMLADCFPDTDKNTAPAAVFFFDPNSANNPMSAVQLTTYIGADELDALICNKSTMDFIDTPGVMYYPEGRDFPGYDLSETEYGKRLLDIGFDSVYYIILEGDNVAPAMAFGQYLLEH